MHMADALISPVVGGAMLAVTAGAAAYSIKKVQNDMDDRKIPLMGVMGAFVFAAQMINFTIPMTGSSGHLGGGTLLAALLGPYAGFLTMASILLIQALVFADGGLLAYGCNVFNLGFFTCFLLYPLVFRRITCKGITQKRIFAASMLSAVLGLQLGAFSVVLETLLSGKSELPFDKFVLLMQPIHLAIGIVEGLVTAAVVTFVWKARPEIIESVSVGRSIGKVPMKRVITVLAILAVVTGGVLSWFASSNPDGLEWSMLKTAGVTELETKDGAHEKAAEIQDKTAFLPDYGFKAADAAKNAEGGEMEAETPAEAAAWPAVNAGTSVSGIAGGLMTLALAGAAALLINAVKKKNRSKEPI